MKNCENEIVDRMEETPPRLPPYSEETEAAVLACILHQPNEVLADIKRLGLNRNTFYTQRHKFIWEGIRAVMADSLLPDTITVMDRMKADGTLEKCGGIEYLGTLPESLSVLFEQNVTRLHDLRKRRKAIQHAQAVTARAHDLTEPIEGLGSDVEFMLDHANSGAKGSLPPIVSASEFIAKHIPEPPQLVHGVLHQGCKMVLGGNSKGRKTWTFIDLAISVAAGEPWFSFKTTKGKVLYLNFELKDFEMQERLRAIEQSKGVKVAEGAMDLWNLEGRCASYTELFPKIQEQIKTCKYSLIILDPVYKCYGDTDENAAGQVAKLMNAIGRLTSETGAAVVFAAHYAKGNAASKEAIDRISGSGVFARDPDAIMNLTRHETDDAFVVECTLRNFKPVEPFVVRWDYPLMRRDENLDPKKLKGAGAASPAYSPEQIVGLLKEPMTLKQWQQLANEQLGISRATFYRLKNRAEESGLIEPAANNRWQRAGGLNGETGEIGETETGSTTETSRHPSQSQPIKGRETETKTENEVIVRQE